MRVARSFILKLSLSFWTFVGCGAEPKNSENLAASKTQGDFKLCSVLSDEDIGKIGGAEVDFLSQSHLPNPDLNFEVESRCSYKLKSTERWISIDGVKKNSLQEAQESCRIRRAYYLERARIIESTNDLDVFVTNYLPETVFLMFQHESYCVVLGQGFLTVNLDPLEHQRTMLENLKTLLLKNLIVE